MIQDPTTVPPPDSEGFAPPDSLNATGNGAGASPDSSAPDPGAPTAAPPAPAPPPIEAEPTDFSPVQRTGEPAEIDPAEFDQDALKVVHRLRSRGHQAYFVGGCVRDLLLGRKPKDFDVCTSAHPNEVRDTFRNCRLIGRRFRLAHVYFKGGKIIEVSTFRTIPEVGAREEDVGGLEAGEDNAEREEPQEDLLITADNEFGTAEQDARRRDFTINGLFYDVGEGRVIDYVRGRRDLDERYIRTIGDPEIRMREDPVRILRAVRFACKLDFDIESATYAAMEGVVEDLPRCAPARLLEETFRLIRGGVAAPSLKLLSALDALKILLPPIDAFLKEYGPEGEKTFYAHAAALDKRVTAGGEQLEDAILLAVLLLPISRMTPEAPSDGEGRPSVAQAIEDLLSQLVRTARLPRRIAERCRMLLVAQRTLTGERRRRGPLGAFRKHPLFDEALTVFELSVEATGEHREALDAWKTGSSPAVRPDSAGAPRKRRRRRRRGPGEGGDGGAPPGGEGGE